jgi:predicted TIM-barrel fold metal-dependent hydrolase
MTVQLLTRVSALIALLLPSAGAFVETPEDLKFNDSHFHLTNYVQEGPSVREYLNLMGDRVKRSALFGIPLQQQWSYRVSGKSAPTYYLDTDAPLYYYSFVDAAIAMAYKSLPEEQRQRLDPMIIGFNPSDMYAVDHIRRVLRLFPGVFSGIGEFTIHKEFVSSKISGEIASLTDPALDRIFEFAGEAGLLTLIHNDIQMPFAKEHDPLIYFDQLIALFRRHPKTKVIWAHLGLGRVIHPVKGQAALVEKILKDPTLNHVHFDISWDELAKYLNATPETAARVAKVFNRYPDRFLFGTDEVASRDPKKHFQIFDDYTALWKLLTPEASEKIRLRNYERLFDESRLRVRAWEKANSV